MSGSGNRGDGPARSGGGGDLRSALQKIKEQVAAGSLPQPSVRAPLVEIFQSVQGEGRFVGVPMAFVRMATCPIRCLYCDTPNSYEAQATFPVRTGVRPQTEPNPVSAERAAQLVQQVIAGAGTAGRPPRVSVTGGEPLVFPEFVRELGRILRGKGFRLHLETAALDADALQKCVDQVDHLSADYKLPETVAGAPNHGKAHVRCCQVAIARGTSVDVKVVLTPKVLDHSLEQALQDLLPVREKIVLILQPATPFGAVAQPVARQDLERFVTIAARAGFDLRVLPQVHRQLQVP
jgi:organic radical activating enzyme